MKKEAIRLLALTLAQKSEPVHLQKAITYIVKRLKDTDTGIKDTCRDAIGTLSGAYLKGGDSGILVSVFAKPLFEAMGEQNKAVQGGASTCMARMVECAGETPVGAFQKMSPRICKFLNSPNFLAKSALLPVISSLSQVGAVAPQSLEPLLQSINDCLGSSDWATRKAAADTLTALASFSSNLISDGVAASTISVLEACRFDKIKPVRDSMTEALQLWKKIAGKEDEVSNNRKNVSRDGENSETPKSSDKKDQKFRSPNNTKADMSPKDSSNGSPLNDVTSKGKSGNILDKAVGILKKKAPTLTEKGLNPEFFEKLAKRASDDLPVEVVVPRRCQTNDNVQNEENLETKVTNLRENSKQLDDELASVKNRIAERGNGGGFSRQRDLSEERGNGKESRTNWLAIQRQLLQMERQQAHLMNMLQEFMGGSHDSMVTLENRVRGLERVVDDMARDFSSRRGSNFMAGYEGSSNRPLGKYNNFSDYPGAKFGRNNEAWASYGDRFGPSDLRTRGSSWRPDGSESWYGKNGQMGPRRGLGGGPIDVRSPKSDDGRRVWDKGVGPIRLGEGPSARSVWQASKDEATLEAIRVAGEDGTARGARVEIPEMTLEAMGEDGSVPERDPVWTCWSNAMDALHAGDVDSAYAEVLATGDDLLLVKIMDRTGAVVDQLSGEVAAEVLHAVAQFLQEHNLYDVCLFWIQQLDDIIGENGADALDIPNEVKREILVNLQDACSAMDPPEDWEGTPPDQLLLHLASAWGIDLQHLDK